MNIDPLFLIPSLLLLWFPRKSLGKGMRLLQPPKNKFTDPRTDREPGDLALRAREEFAKVRNYVDLIRGIAGSYGLMYWSFGSPSEQKNQENPTVLIIQILVFVLAVLSQTIRWKNRLTLVAPVFFLAGISVGISGYEAALYGTIATWLIHSLLSTPTVFLLTQTALIAVFSLLFSGTANAGTYMAAGISLIPALASLTLGRPLAIGTKKNRI